MEVRHCLGWGGDGTTIRIMVLNDTGSDLEVLLALFVEVRLLRPVTLIAWGDWFEELAVLREIGPGVARLSGGRIRNHFFFGTRPGNLQVAVSSTKGGLNAII